MPARVVIPEPELVWKGEWSPEVTYPPESVVGFEGSSWVTEIISIGQPPTEGFPWSLVALRGDKGDTGDPGEPGDLANRQTPFVQSVPEHIWVIEHNLGYDPAVSVIDSAGTAVTTEIRYVISGVRVEIHNAYPFSGKAILV